MRTMEVLHSGGIMCLKFYCDILPWLFYRPEIDLIKQLFHDKGEIRTHLDRSYESKILNKFSTREDLYIEL